MKSKVINKYYKKIVDPKSNPDQGLLDSDVIQSLTD